MQTRTGVDSTAHASGRVNVTNTPRQDGEARLALEVYGLRRWFGRDFQAIKNSWFSVEEGQLFCLLGPNGAGKSTTINCLTGEAGGSPFCSRFLPCSAVCSPPLFLPPFRGSFAPYGGALLERVNDATFVKALAVSSQVSRPVRCVQRKDDALKMLSAVLSAVSCVSRPRTLSFPLPSAPLGFAFSACNLAPS